MTSKINTMWMRAAAVCLLALGTSAWAAEGKVVTVTGEGLNKDDALKQAFRAALEQGAGAEIAGFSQVENFELIRDRIYSKASGLVKEYEILEEKKGAGGTVIVKIRATVRPSEVVATWGEVQNTIEQVGRPKMMVIIAEYIDGELARDSIVGQRIEEMFVEVGFEMVGKDAVQELMERQTADASLEGNELKVQRLAKDAGAHIYIRGTANADQAGIEDIYGTPIAFYNCDVLARAYWTDNAKLIASESLPVTRAGTRSRRSFSPQAARLALVKATFPDEQNPYDDDKLAKKLFDSVMESFMRQITAGGEVTVVVEKLEAKGFIKLKKAFETMERIDHVAAEFSKGAGTFRLKTQIAADNMFELLVESPFDDLLSPTGVSMNRIDAVGAN